MSKTSLERRALQIVIAVFCLVPLSAGSAGVFAGLRFAGGLDTLNAQSHFAYLSGLLLAIGFGFLSCIPRIEAQASRIRLLSFIVFVGGLARLYALVLYGIPGIGMVFGLGMELLVTPLICLWQGRVARAANSLAAVR